MPELCLLTVHAHPDDESSKGAASVARYHAEGVHTVLVCCTGGEEGDILNPAMDRPEVRERLADIRRAELHEAAGIIGYDEVVLLGYRDSGMPGTPANEDPRAFARAPLDEAVGRLVAVIRRARPQVVVTYPEGQRGYPHPDHLRVHEITLPAVAAAGDPTAYPEAGPPWTPSKLYYTSWSRRRIMALHEKYLELGLESPFTGRWLDRSAEDRKAKDREAEDRKAGDGRSDGHQADGREPGDRKDSDSKANDHKANDHKDSDRTGSDRPAEDDTTTRIAVSGFVAARDRALRAHATQVDPTSRFWFGLPPEVAETVYPYEEYVLAESTVPVTLPEDDLFAGLPDLVSR